MPKKKYSIDWEDDEAVSFEVNGVEYKILEDVPDETDRLKLEAMMDSASDAEFDAEFKKMSEEVQPSGSVSPEKIIVGVNKFQAEEKNPIPVFKVDENVQTLQVEKLKALRARRDNDKVMASLKTLDEKARSSENLMPTVLEAVENYCTLGEISDELRKVFGEYK